MLNDHATCNQGLKPYDLSASKNITKCHSIIYSYNVIYCGNAKRQTCSNSENVCCVCEDHRQ